MNTFAPSAITLAITLAICTALLSAPDAQAQPQPLADNAATQTVVVP